MAVNIKSGDLNQKVVFKQPTSSLNDQKEKTVSYSSQIITWAAVKRFNKNRTTEAHADALIGSLDFYVRYSVDRAAITKAWLINYRNADFVIQEIEPVEISETKERFLRFTAKTKE